MAFIPKSPNTLKNVIELTSNGTYAANTLISFNRTTGAIQAAGAASIQTEGLFRVLGSVTTGQTMQVEVMDRSSVFVVDSVNNSNTAHTGQRMILDATGGLLNNTGTDVGGATGVFMQIGVVGAAADKKILAVRA